MKLEVLFRGRLEFDSQPPLSSHEDELEATIDAIVDELLELDSIIDPIVSGKLTTGEIDITMTADGDDPADIFATCHTAMRSALHAAGVCTPDWDDHQGNGRVVTVIWDEQTVTGFDRSDDTAELACL